MKSICWGTCAATVIQASRSGSMYRSSTPVSAQPHEVLEDALRKRIGGVTYRETATHVRMREAARLLLEAHETPIRLIARSVGYREPAQFAKAFRRAHGVNPSDFRSRRA